MASLFCANPPEWFWDASSIPKWEEKDSSVTEVSPEQRWKPQKTVWFRADVRGCEEPSVCPQLIQAFCCVCLCCCLSPQWPGLFLVHISPFCLWGAFPSFGKHTAATGSGTDPVTSTSPRDLGGGERLPRGAEQGSFWGTQRKALRVCGFFKVAEWDCLLRDSRPLARPQRITQDDGTLDWRRLTQIWWRKETQRSPAPGTGSVWGPEKCSFPTSSSFLMFSTRRGEGKNMH